VGELVRMGGAVYAVEGWRCAQCGQGWHTQRELNRPAERRCPACGGWGQRVEDAHGEA
jgi:rubrerythrin